MNGKEFQKGWKHFCERVDFNHSNLDAKAIKFMNEMPDAAYAALESDALSTAKNRCRVCGCSNDHACPGGCHWIESDLCSDCA